VRLTPRSTERPDLTNDAHQLALSPRFDLSVIASPLSHGRMDLYEVTVNNVEHLGRAPWDCLHPFF
jgi:hypothetical protein